jgi:hypothetical protein
MKNATYALATSVNFIVTLGLFSSMFLLPIFFQNFRGIGALETGILLLPQAVASGLMVPVSGKLFDKIGPRPLMVTGLCVLGYATWRFAYLTVDTPDSTIRTILICRGLAMDLITMPAMTVAMNTLSGPLIARGSALTNVLRQLFAAFGTAIFSTILQTRQSYHLERLSQAATPDQPGIQIFLAMVRAGVVRQGIPIDQAQAVGVMLLYKQVVLQAAVLAFDNCFFVSGAICFIGLVPALLLSGKGTEMTLPGRPSKGREALSAAAE